MFGSAFFWDVSGEYTAYFFMTDALFCNDSDAANFPRQTGYQKCCVTVCLSSYKQRRGNISQQATAATCHCLPIYYPLILPPKTTLHLVNYRYLSRG